MPLLTTENLSTLEHEALEKLATSPERCKTRLTRFITAAADLRGALCVIEARDRIEKMKATPTLPFAAAERKKNNGKSKPAPREEAEELTEDEVAI